MLRFYAIAYTDHEGDEVVKHALLEPEDAAKLVAAMAEAGVEGSVTDLSLEPELRVRPDEFAKLTHA